MKKLNLMVLMIVTTFVALGFICSDNVYANTSLSFGFDSDDIVLSIFLKFFVILTLIVALCRLFNMKREKEMVKIFLLFVFFVFGYKFIAPISTRDLGMIAGLEVICTIISSIWILALLLSPKNILIPSMFLVAIAATRVSVSNELYWSYFISIFSNVMGIVGIGGIIYHLIWNLPAYSEEEGSQRI